MNHLDGIAKVLKTSATVKLVDNVKKIFKEVTALCCSHSLEILYFDCLWLYCNQKGIIEISSSKKELQKK